MTLSATQWAGFSAIDLGTGGNTLNVLASGTATGLVYPTTANVTTGNLVGTGGSDAVTLGGAQLDALLSGAGMINFGAGNADVLNLTSQSTDLDALGSNDAAISGLETIFGATATGNLSIHLGGQTEAFVLTGGSGADALAGGSGADTIDGGANDDKVSGGAGNDTLYGGAGRDTIFGAIGNDALYGSSSKTGDGVADTFVFNTALNAATNVDTLYGFDAGGSGSGAIDKIFLDKGLFSAIGPTFVANEFRANVGGNAAAGADRILYDTKTGTLYYDADGSGGAFAKVAFAMIDTHSISGVLDFTDFSFGNPPAGP